MATYTTAVQSLYVAYFNRPADAKGLAYWEGVVAANNGDTSLVSAAFAGSVEYQTEYSQITTAGVLSKVYQNLFGHSPDSAGLAYWVKSINDKNFTIDQAVTQIAAGALTTDKVAYDSKVLVATAFTNSLTVAEADGYTGADANAAAKIFLATITTAAQATAAIAPAALDASVAVVVKAGIPFTLTDALTTLVVANDAKAAFLVTADNDGNSKTSATDLQVKGAVLVQETAIDPLVGGVAYVGASAGIKAALLADEIALRGKALVTAQTAVTAANVEIAKVDGLAAAIAADAAADAAYIAAQKVTVIADANLTAAVATFNTNSGVAAVAMSGAGDGSVAGLIKYTAATKALSLEAGVTEATNPGVTALLSASVALEAAQKAEASTLSVDQATQVAVNRGDFDAAVSGPELVAVGAAMHYVTIVAGAYPTAAQITTEINALHTAKLAADAAYAAITTPTPTDTTTHDTAVNAESTFLAKVNAFDLKDGATNPLTLVLTTAEGNVKTASADIKVLNAAIVKLDAATAAVAQLKAFDAAITAAGDTFVAHNFAVPVTLDAAVVLASDAADIFVAGASNSTVFGMTANDSLFIGADYALNVGKLATGNNAALEVFVAQSGADTIVTIETETYGSASGDTIAITLTGVLATNVHFANGIITV